MQPTFGHGKICYLEMPATDVNQSADFYAKVFGWNVRTRGDGSVSFDDGAGQVSGVWVLKRKPEEQPGVGIMLHIMVDDAAATLAAITAAEGELVQGIGADLPEITAKFRDPGGNLMGIYQHHR